MADILDIRGGGPPAPDREPPGIPDLAKNRGQNTGVVTRESLEREAASFHRVGLRTRRHRDLVSEKYALHLDGEGQNQWTDVFRGQRLRVPPSLLGGKREQNNQLRPITDNMVAHLTTQTYRFTVHSQQDRESRERAKIDQALINHTVRGQRWNSVWAAAKYVAAAFGSCPVHSMWRDDDLDDTAYEGTEAGRKARELMAQGAMPGSIDTWIGNPWATVYDAGATRWRVHRATYERVLPAKLVREAFQRQDIEGTDRLTSASIYNRIGQRWAAGGDHDLGIGHVMAGNSNTELVSLLYDEIPPGILPDYPNGRLLILALQGSQGALDSPGSSEARNATLLWVGELPAKTFSFTRVYSHHGRMDDVLGKPFIADIDDDQIELNQLETMAAEYFRRANRPPLGSSGRINEGTLDFNGDAIIEVDQLGTGAVELNWLEYPGQHIDRLERKIARVLEGMYRKGGWQAASRGETDKGQSGKAIIALQQADDSIFGPLTEQTKIELQHHAQLCWRLYREYADIPLVIDLVGDELAHLAEPYVDRTMLSSRAPHFQLTSGFGVTPEAEAQQLINLLNVRDYRGEGVITAADVRRLWPDQRLFSDTEDPDEVRRRRPRAINQMLRDASEQYLQQYQDQVANQMGDPMTAQLGRLIAMEVDQREPAQIDDDIEAHIDTLSLITQDVTESPVVRHAAMVRQKQYFMWAAQRQAASGQAAPGQPGPAQPVDESKEGTAVNKNAEGGTSNANAMRQADKRASQAQPRSA